MVEACIVTVPGYYEEIMTTHIFLHVNVSGRESKLRGTRERGEYRRAVTSCQAKKLMRACMFCTSPCSTVDKLGPFAPCATL
jgi:hypothetical protein